MTLGELCSFKGGNAFPQDEQGRSGGAAPFIKVSDLSGPRNASSIVAANNWVDEAQIASLKLSLFPAGSSVFAKIGEGMKSERVRTLTVPTAIDNNLMAAVPNATTDSSFLFYLLQTVRLASHAVGSALPYLTQSTLQQVPVRVPPLREQQAIAEVLGALDDKIAANTALAATALELADKLFPPELGESSTRLGDFVSVTKGNSYKSADLAASDHALVTLKSITRDGRYAVEGLKQFTGGYKAQQVISPGEIVVAQTDLTQAAEVVGRAVRVPASVDYTLIASLDLAIVRPLDDVDQTYLLGLLRQPRFREHCRSNTTGTTVLHLRSGAIEEFTVQLADTAAQEAYARATLPLQQTADSANAENRVLAALRDALLPRLMSGKLRVRDAEEAASRAGA